MRENNNYLRIRRTLPVLRMADARDASVVPVDTAQTHFPSCKTAVLPDSQSGFSKRHAKQDAF